MADLEPCTVGVQLQATHDCHKTFYCRQTGCKALREMSPSNALLLQLRTGIMSLTESDRVCFHHEKVYVDRYEDLQKACCDPFNTHKKAIKKGLKPLDLDEAMFLSEKFARHLVPGWKLCFRCSQLLTGYCNLDPNAGQRKTRNSEGRTAKALKSLQFANPGRQTEFAAEPGRRDKRRLQPNKTVTNADRQSVQRVKCTTAQGLLISSGLDLCDCLDEDCLGCFYPCPECRSRKCGVECRCDRKWLYEQVEIKAGDYPQ